MCEISQDKIKLRKISNRRMRKQPKQKCYSFVHIKILDLFNTEISDRKIKFPLKHTTSNTVKEN